MRQRPGPVIPAAVLAAILSIGPGLAMTPAARADDSPYTLVLQDHRFQPSQLEIPAGQTVKLVIRNLDVVMEEFDSPDLHKEKVILPGTSETITIGPLNPGTYHFTGEFHAGTAVGVLVAKPARQSPGP